jgi:hypothetical protein
MYSLLTRQIHMKLQIDNNDGLGPQDYTPAIDGSIPARVTRKLNQPVKLQISLVANSPSFVVSGRGARVVLGMTSGQDLFTGYLTESPVFEYLGWGERGPVYRYNLIAQSDEALLDEKRLPQRCPFVERSAGSALRQLTEDLLPGIFNTNQVQDLDLMAWWASDPQKTWAQEAAQIAIQARACYRILNGAMVFSPVGANIYTLNENDANFSPDGLKLQPVNALVNDVTVIGEIEPQAYVKDYFVGDGLTYRFYLSQTPFIKKSTTLFDEEYTTSPLEPTLWNLTDPANVVSVSGGKLQIAGGTGVDGGTAVQFVEKVELGGAWVMQHGDVQFSAASTGVLGGLYAGSLSAAGCLAGFQIMPSGTQSSIQALVNGALTGIAITTIAGHHYVLTTRLYSDQVYRRQQTFHSSLHPAGNGWGGAESAAEVRMVLEVHDIDPANPGSQVAPSAVLYDGVIPSAPDFCTYAPVNATNLQCAIAFTRMIQAVDAEVRTALPGLGYSTMLVGPLSDGAECDITSTAELEFYSAYIPAANEAISVHYRGQGRALAWVINPASIAAQQRGFDNGDHAAVRHIKEPPPRTSADCENAALAILDDSCGPAWSGEYDTWSDFLPGNAGDIFPGDGLSMNVPSRGAVFLAIVREVDVEVSDFADEQSHYKIKFANDAATPLGFEVEGTLVTSSLVVTQITNSQVGTNYLADLIDAEVTVVGSTTISVDAGVAPPNGGGFEVRWGDSGWGQGNDRNLVGRFANQTFALPRLSQIQDYYLRQYNASSPPLYSRATTALHVDYPL